MSEAEGFTPTTEQVRTEWVESNPNASEANRLHAGAAFDHWLAARDRWVASGALVDAAADIRARGDVGEDGGPTIERYLTIRAKNIVQS